MTNENTTLNKSVAEHFHVENQSLSSCLFLISGEMFLVYTGRLGDNSVTLPAVLTLGIPEVLVLVQQLMLSMTSVAQVRHTMGE